MARAGWFAAVAVLVTAGVLVVRASGHVADEVQPIAWNAEPCAHCHMLVGEPAYAAQLVTEDGTVLDFDDPGCALRYVAEHHPEVHRLWFHLAHRDAWVAIDQVAFVRGAATPMGSGLAAVERGTPGSIEPGAALGALP